MIEKEVRKVTYRTERSGREVLGKGYEWVSRGGAEHEKKRVGTLGEIGVIKVGRSVAEGNSITLIPGAGTVSICEVFKVVVSSIVLIIVRSILHVLCKQLIVKRVWSLEVCLRPRAKCLVYAMWLKSHRLRRMDPSYRLGVHFGLPGRLKTAAIYLA